MVGSGRDAGAVVGAGAVVRSGRDVGAAVGAGARVGATCGEAWVPLRQELINLRRAAPDNF